MSKGELVKDLQRSLKDQFKLSSTAGPSRTTDSRLATSSSSTAISIPTASLTPESPALSTPSPVAIEPRTRTDDHSGAKRDTETKEVRFACRSQFS